MSELFVQLFSVSFKVIIKIDKKNSFYSIYFKMTQVYISFEIFVRYIALDLFTFFFLIAYYYFFFLYQMF